MLSNHASDISNVLLIVTNLKSGDISTSNYASNLSNGLLIFNSSCKGRGFGFNDGVLSS
jgi:hypothetical protein